MPAEPGGSKVPRRMVVLVVVLAVLALAGWRAYLASPFHDPYDTGPARERAAKDADTLDRVLQNDLFRNSNEGSEITFEREAARFDGTLLDTRQHQAGGERFIEGDFLFALQAAPWLSLGDTSQLKTVQVCYRFSYHGALYTMEHHTIHCPAGLPSSRPGPAAYPPGPATGEESPPAAQQRLAGLAATVYSAEPRPDPAAEPTAGQLDAVLGKAKVNPGTPRTSAVRPGIALVALGRPHDCLFVMLGPNGLSAWAAPWQAPCTTDRAFEGYALTQWPPLPDS